MAFGQPKFEGGKQEQNSVARFDSGHEKAKKCVAILNATPCIGDTVTLVIKDGNRTHPWSASIVQEVIEHTTSKGTKIGLVVENINTGEVATFWDTDIEDITHTPQ